MLKIIKKWIKCNLSYYFPKLFANYLHYRRVGKLINWSCPRDFNEKMRWLQFNSDTSIWPVLADKYEVRNYLSSKGYNDILVDLFGVWKDENDIDFSVLPDSFVLKTNNGSGDVIVVKDKGCVDVEEIRRRIGKSLRSQFGLLTVEPHYLQISPKIIAERYLADNIIDYKFFCINGEPQCVLIISDRDILRHRFKVNLFDMNWISMREKITAIYEVDETVIKPISFDRMKDVVKSLSASFSAVRIDLYEVNGKIFFGEFTFTSAACEIDYFTDDYLLELGLKLKVC